MHVLLNSDIDVIGRRTCKCVNCKEDNVCGGLWKAVEYEGANDDLIERKTIHIVVSHCENDLSWISNFSQDFNVESVHIFTKCGNSVQGAPPMAKLVRLPNVGRCDHSFVTYITSYLEGEVSHNSNYEDHIVFFLKDDMSDRNEHQHGKWNDFLFMIRVASSSNGFSCGITQGTAGGFDLSSYHDTEMLLSFSRDGYESFHHRYNSDSAQFKSSFSNLGDFYRYITEGDVTGLPQISQVCYGGVFATKVSNIVKVKMSIWRSAEHALSRGNNIEEGHFMERLWAVLLSKHLKPYQMDALRVYADQIIPPPQRFRRSHWGCLLRKVRQ